MIKALKESGDYVTGWAVHSDSEPRLYQYTISQRERWAERHRLMSSPRYAYYPCLAVSTDVR